MDDRTPVLVGVAQLSHRDGGAPSPLDLLVEVARGAAADSGAPGLLDRAGVVGVVDVASWPVPDPARLLADALGLAPRQTWRTVRGGTGPVTLLGEACDAVAAGHLDVALLAGVEVVTPFRAGADDWRALGWPQQPEGTAPDRLLGHDEAPSSPEEVAAGLLAPVAVYPLLEGPLRRATGRTPAEHQEALGRLQAGFARVARTVPEAWVVDPPTDPAVLAHPSPSNRLVSLPYTKLMNANIFVDQAAAVLVCSAGAARATGVPADRWVAVHATAEAHDHWHVSTRDRLDDSPALRAVTGAVLGAAGLGVDDVALLDLYSCFPSAVQVAARALGIDPFAGDRDLTLTGGLVFFGGPGNDYATHALVQAVRRLREQPDEAALATAVGWFLTKHGAVVLSARPPARPWRPHAATRDALQAAVDALPRRPVDPDPRGEHPLEACTALYGRDGRPTLGIAAALAPDGRRLLAQSTDPDEVEALVAGDPLDRPVAFHGAGRVVAAG